MRAAGRVVAEMHERIRAAIRPGVTTADLDRIGRDVLERRGATSNFLGYHGYPAVICASVNETVVHGIPSATIRLEEGDLVSIDCGAIVDGWHGDAAFTAGVGTVSAEAERLIAVAEAALGAGHRRRWCPATGSATWAPRWRRRCWPPGSTCCGTTAATGSAGPCTSGPTCPTTGGPGRGPKLAPGVVLAVEPMVVAGSTEVEVLDDGWSVRTGDGRWAAHTEHTIAVTDDGPES